MFSSDDEWQWWLKTKVNRCHLWRTKHCPEIELQQLWVLDTTLKWMCYYLRFNLKKWNFKWQLERSPTLSLYCVFHTLVLPLCCARVGLHLRPRPAWVAVSPLWPGSQPAQVQTRNVWNCRVLHVEETKTLPRHRRFCSVHCNSRSDASLLWFLSLLVSNLSRPA